MSDTLTAPTVDDLVGGDSPSTPSDVPESQSQSKVSLTKPIVVESTESNGKPGFIVIFSKDGSFKTPGNIGMVKSVGLCVDPSESQEKSKNDLPEEGDTATELPDKVISKAVEKADAALQSAMESNLNAKNAVSSATAVKDAKEKNAPGDDISGERGKVEKAVSDIDAELKKAEAALTLVNDAFNTINDPELSDKVSDELKNTLNTKKQEVNDKLKKVKEIVNQITGYKSTVEGINQELTGITAVTPPPPPATPVVEKKTFVGTAIYSGESDNTDEQTFRQNHKGDYVTAANFAIEGRASNFSENANKLFEEYDEYTLVTGGTVATVNEDMGENFLTIEFKFEAPADKEKSEIEKMFNLNLDKFKLKLNTIAFNDGSPEKALFTNDGIPTSISLKEVVESEGGGSRRKRNKRKKTTKRKPRKPKRKPRKTKRKPRKPRKTISRKPRKTVKRKSNRRVKTRRKRR